MQNQHAALKAISSHLDMNVLTLEDAFDGISANSRKELDRQRSLLAGVDADLEMIAHVDIHRDFASTSMKRAMDNGEKGRTLASYVSKGKMQQVAAVCAKYHSMSSIRVSSTRLTRGSKRRTRTGTAGH